MLRADTFSAIGRSSIMSLAYEQLFSIGNESMPTSKEQDVAPQRAGRGQGRRCYMGRLSKLTPHRRRKDHCAQQGWRRDAERHRAQLQRFAHDDRLPLTIGGASDPLRSQGKPYYGGGAGVGRSRSAKIGTRSPSTPIELFGSEPLLQGGPFQVSGSF
jgi:hypothetical protein